MNHCLKNPFRCALPLAVLLLNYLITIRSVQGTVGSWNTTAAMGTAREHHTATTLFNGKVLVVGGFSGYSGTQLLGLLSAELFDPAGNSGAGSWSTTTPSLPDNRGRYDHTATLMPDGKVLVAGGQDGFDNIADTNITRGTWLFDPTANGGSGSWTAKGAMNNYGRWFHTATLLPNGKVLATGGKSAGLGYLKTAELYDPSTGYWTPTSDMSTARELHTATLMQNGKVLVVGGDNGGSPLKTYEIFDPAGNSGAGSWTTTANTLNDGRWQHAAVLLLNGQVLVAGGDNDFGQSELYDPIQDMWTKTTGMMPVKVYRSTATFLPNGEVLVAGGGTGAEGSGGDIGSGWATTAQLYDPIAKTWMTTGSLYTARAAHAAALLSDGRVLVTGGEIASSGTTATPNSEIYDTGFEGEWFATGPLNNSRAYHTATLLPSGQVLVTGGYNGSSYLNSAELYHPSTMHWSTTTSMHGSHAFHTATLLSSGKVLVAGGGTLSGSPSGSPELYDPTASPPTWTVLSPMNDPRFYHTATFLSSSGTVLVAGGYPGGSDGESAGDTLTAELYDPSTESWSFVGPMNDAREQHTATLLQNGQVLVAGGRVNGTTLLDSAELYDPSTGNWTTTISMGSTRYLYTATLLSSGKVLAAGGNVNSAEVYDPIFTGWTATGNSMSATRWEHTAVLLSNGKVLVAGGTDGGAFLNSADLYDPTSGSGSWTATGAMGTGRYNHTATVLPNGFVLVVGGNVSGGTTTSAELYIP